MRKLQNIISNFGKQIVRQGNELVVRIDALRSLRASSSALSHGASALSLADYWLGMVGRSWQAPAMAVAAIGTVGCTTTDTYVVKQPQRRHQIMCHRAAA